MSWGVRWAVSSRSEEEKKRRKNETEKKKVNIFLVIMCFTAEDGEQPNCWLELCMQLQLQPLGESENADVDVVSSQIGLLAEAM